MAQRLWVEMLLPQWTIPAALRFSFGFNLAIAQPHFFFNLVFSIQLKVQKQFADDWIRTTDLKFQRQPTALPTEAQPFPSPIFVCIITVGKHLTMSALYPKYILVL